MKEIKMDWETYKKELKESSEEGATTALYHVSHYLKSGQKWGEWRRYKAIHADLYFWKDILSALGRLDEFEEKSEKEDE